MHNLFRLSSRSVARGLLLQAARRPRAARRVRQGPDRHHRLPVRRGADLAAHRRLRQGASGRGVPGHLRQGQLLPRADGPRPRHRDPGPRRACFGSPRTSASRRSPPTTRTTSTPATRWRTSTCSASRPAARWPTRTGSSSTATTSTSSRRPRCARCGPTSTTCRRPATTRCSSPSAATSSSPRATANYMPRFPVPAGRDRGDLVRQGGRAGPALPLSRRHSPTVRAAGRLRGRRHRPDGLPGYFLVVADFINWAKEQRHPGRARAAAPGAGSMGAYAMRITDLDPLRARPDLRAVPQPRARLDARLRHRLRRAPARRGDPLRHRQVRRRPGRADRHLRHHQGQAGGQGLRPGPRLPVRDGRPDHQGDAARGHGQGRPAHGDLRHRPQALRRGRRVPRALRGRPRRQEGRRHRDRPRGPEAAVGRARGRA